MDSFPEKTRSEVAAMCESEPVFPGFATVEMPPGMSGNPVLPGWYADPEPHLFEGKFYIYPTTSLEDRKQTYFEVWSPGDITDWKYGGVVLDFREVS